MTAGITVRAVKPGPGMSITVDPLSLETEHFRSGGGEVSRDSGATMGCAVVSSLIARSIGIAISLSVDLSRKGNPKNAATCSPTLRASP